MNCPYCNTPLPEGADFCPACGAKIEQPAASAAAPQQPQKRLCAVCGRELKEGAGFCSVCGAPVGGQPDPRPAPAAASPQQPYGRSQYPPQGHSAPQPSAPYPQGQPPAAPYPPQQRQQAPYGQQPYPPQQQPYAPPRRKRKLAVPIIALVLVAAILFTGLVSPGFFLKKSRAEALINRVQVHIPNPTGPEAVVRLVGEVALQYYIEARLYLEKLSQYDLTKLDEQEFGELVTNTLAAFENAEKMSYCLSDAVDLWMKCDDVREEATYTVVQEAKGDASPRLFAMKAHAAGTSPAEVRAQDIIDAFDKAKSGQKLQAVADFLGTDTQHAYVHLKMALAGEEKITYDKIADQADTCVKVAKTLKTAGTVAGVVIAAAPIATGAVATMAAGEMLATGTGVVVSAVNAGLEVTSTGAMLYHGTDDNRVTQIADAVSDSKFMKTVNLISGVASLGYNAKNAIESLENIAKSGGGAKEVGTFLNTLSSSGGTSDMFGIYSFGLSNLDLLPGPEGAIANEGMKSLITMVTHTGEDGLTVDIADTLIGTGKNQIEAVKRLLDELKLPDLNVRGMLDSAVGLYRGEQSSDIMPSDPADPAPLDVVDKLLSANSFIAPVTGNVDPAEITDLVKSFLGELSMYKRVTDTTLNPLTEPTATPQPTASPAPTPEPTPEPTPTPTPEPTPESTPVPTPGPGEPGAAMETWLEFLDGTWQSADFSFTSSGRSDKTYYASPNCNLRSVVEGWIGSGIGCAVDPATGNLAFTVTSEISHTDAHGNKTIEYFDESGSISFVDENTVRMRMHRYRGDSTELFTRAG